VGGLGLPMPANGGVRGSTAPGMTPGMAPGTSVGSSFDGGFSGNGGVKSPGVAPFSFGGSADDGAGRFNFSGSLSQMRKASEANDAAKLAQAGQSARLNGQSGPAIGSSSRRKDDIFDIWVEGQSSYFSKDGIDGRRQGHAAVVYAGADMIVRPGVLIGVMYERDWIAESSNTIGQNRDGAGWMAGPYLGLRLTKNVFFDALYMRGTATNHVDPIGAYVDTFTSQRERATARLTGDWTHGVWRFRPSVEMSYFTEQQKGYVNQIGIAIPETRITLGTTTFGPEIGYRMQLSDKSVLEPYLGFKGVWDFAKERLVTASGVPADHDTLRGRIEAGATYRMQSGVSVRASGAYDGIGSDTYSAWRGQAFVVVPLK
jgi:outer membrane autotransporter protein